MNTLSRLGESEHDISAVFAECAVRFRLTRDSDLLKLWNEPDKLYHRLLKQGKTSNPLNLQGQVRMVRREGDQCSFLWCQCGSG